MLRISLTLQWWSGQTQTYFWNRNKQSRPQECEVEDEEVEGVNYEEAIVEDIEELETNELVIVAEANEKLVDWNILNFDLKLNTNHL